MAHLQPQTPRQRGVSLVEALVALAVMSIGMLALVGVQSTMRLNSDLAKQRSEATRIASEEIELVRSFTSMGVVNGQPGVSYDEIVDRVVESYQPPDGIGNTTYRVVRNVTDLAGSAQKFVSVQVQWVDRTSQPQTVTLDSAISGAAPTLGAMLMVPHGDSASSRNQGRHISIPEGAVDLGDGYSRFQPPGSTGLGWYFNNLTGVLRVCAAGVVNYTTCPLATLVSGTVQFHIASATTAANAESPQGPGSALAPGPGAMTLVGGVGTNLAASCYSVTQGAQAVYFCAVSTSDAGGWGGQLNPVPVDAYGTALEFGNYWPGLGDNLPGQYKSCRFTTDLPTSDDPNAEFTLNANHPRKYCFEQPFTSGDPALCRGKPVKVNLINQNFLVIRGDQSCPTEQNDNGTNNGTGQNPLTLVNTRQHQPAP
jgi:type II secretory pathway pseudopilin PulG